VRRVAVLILIAASVAGARAADGPLPVPSPERFGAHDWSGFKLGLQAGYGWSDYGALRGNGPLVGAFAGYDWQFGQAVAGIEGSVSVADIEVSPGNRLETVVDLRARLGFAMDRVMIYGTVGGVYGGLSGGGRDTGWTAGAGVDFKAGRRTIAGMEYVRYRFDNFANTGNALDVDLIRGKLTYRF
jgi:outer membrane immunogenic protein